METALLEKPTLQMVNSQEIKTVEEWEELYPETWLLIEITKDDPWEGYEGKLVAAATDPMDLVETGMDYDKRKIVTLTTRGISYNQEPMARLPFVSA
jgi:hypothetical protein